MEASVMRRISWCEATTRTEVVMRKMMMTMMMMTMMRLRCGMIIKDESCLPG